MDSQVCELLLHLCREVWLEAVLPHDIFGDGLEIDVRSVGHSSDFEVHSAPEGAIKVERFAAPLKQCRDTKRAIQTLRPTP